MFRHEPAFHPRVLISNQLHYHCVVWAPSSPTQPTRGTMPELQVSNEVMKSAHVWQTYMAAEGSHSFSHYRQKKCNGTASHAAVKRRGNHLPSKMLSIILSNKKSSVNPKNYIKHSYLHHHHFWKQKPGSFDSLPSVRPSVSKQTFTSCLLCLSISTT